MRARKGYLVPRGKVGVRLAGNTQRVYCVARTASGPTVCMDYDRAFSTRQQHREERNRTDQ